MQSPFMPLPDIIELFKRKNFTEDHLNLNAKSGMIAGTIKRAVAAVINSPLDKSNLEQILLEVPGRFDHRKDHVKFTFDFTYNKENNTLRIQAMTAVMNEQIRERNGIKNRSSDAKKLYLFAHTQRLPDANIVYDELNTIRARKALDIYLSSQQIPSLKKVPQL